MALQDTGNFLLNALSNESRSAILSHCELVPLKQRVSIHSEEENPRFAFFLTSGICSVVVTLPEGQSCETALISREGVTSSYSLLGSSPPPTNAFIQVEGAGYRMPFEALRDLFDQSREIRSRILEHVQQQAMTTSQIAACNNQHAAEGRLARWLLMIRDRTGSDRFKLTQEFMAQMLGSQRSTVALAAGMLQRGGLIEYARGNINITSPTALENAACDCYPVTRRLLQNLYRS